MAPAGVPGKVALYFLYSHHTTVVFTTHGFQEGETPHTIRCDCLVRLGKSPPDEWLGSKMKDKIGLVLPKHGLEGM